MIANGKARKFINVAKINPTADCFTDHKLLTGKCRTVVKKNKNKGPKPRPKPETTINAERKEKLEQFLEEQLQNVKNLGMI